MGAVGVAGHHKLRYGENDEEPLSEAELSREIISDLQEGIEKLEEEREILDWRIEQKRERLRAYQAKLGIAPTEPSTERKARNALRAAQISRPF